jgi:hypothetical protein
MHIRIKMYAVLCLSFMLNGCATNTLYFYETEKISLTVEARPDSSQPVQGSLGLKQRVALLVPKKSNEQSADGEALSAISSFNFKIKDESGFNPILIQTAFITGAAANELNGDGNSKKARAVAEAIAYRAQAQSEIEIEQQRLDKILAYVASGSSAIDSSKLNALITKAEKTDPKTMTSTVTGEIKKAKTRSELEKLLFGSLDGAIYPLYKAILTN